MFYRFRIYYTGFILIVLHTKIKETLCNINTYRLSPVTSSNHQPFFDFDVQRNITVTIGQTGFLHCRVDRLGDKDVSWIRKRDLHILTAGENVYTSDQRFQVNRPKNSTKWTLQIKYLQMRDAGIYECQVNTEPKMSLSYTLNVIELKAKISSRTDLYVKTGSDISLTCKISQVPHELGNIFWYKDNIILDSHLKENEIYTESLQRIMVDSEWADELISRLIIRRANINNTGNYSCVPTLAKPANVYVHVITGEHPAAMQHNSAISIQSRSKNIQATTAINDSSSLLFYLTFVLQCFNIMCLQWVVNGTIR